MVSDGLAGSLSLTDWVTIVVTLLGFLAAQFWAVSSYLSREFKKRDDAISEAVRERNNQIVALRAEGTSSREQSRLDTARVDRDIAALRNEISVKLAGIPSREVMESMLRDKVMPLESDLRALVIELARLGVHTPPPQRGRVHPAFRADDGA